MKHLLRLLPMISLFNLERPCFKPIWKEWIVDKKDVAYDFVIRPIEKVIILMCIKNLSINLTISRPSKKCEISKISTGKNASSLLEVNQNGYKMEKKSWLPIVRTHSINMPNRWYGFITSPNKLENKQVKYLYLGVTLTDNSTLFKK